MPPSKIPNADKDRTDNDKFDDESEKKTTETSFEKDDGNNKKSGLRHNVGNYINAVTNVINDNIIAARYGTMASIVLLTVYGITKTPLFLRYQKVSDIPSSLIKSRKIIHGRIVHVVENPSRSLNGAAKNDEPITCLIYQLSPVGRLLNRPAFELMAKISPLSQVHGLSKLEDSRDLLKVEIAGIKAPPFYYASPGKEGVNFWLKNLAANRARVSCELLSRRIPLSKKVPSGASTSVNSQSQDEEQHDSFRFDAFDSSRNESVICKIKFKPGMSIISKDLATSLLAFGRANVASGMHIEFETTRTIDGSQQIGDLETDVKYLEKLAEAEFDAFKNCKGMWASEEIRISRSDLVTEADFDTKAGFWSKLWRRIRS